MNNLDKLKKIWLNLEDVYLESGMSSKRDFLMKYLGYRNGTSGLPKLLSMLQRSCEFNADHEPLPEYKEDYDILTVILNNADKLIQNEYDIESLNLDDIQHISFEETGHQEVITPTFNKNMDSIDIISAIITKFPNSYYDTKTKKHMVLPCVNDKAAIVQKVPDYQRIVTYLITKITCNKSMLFDQLLFRFIIKNNVKPKKYPVNVVYLDSSEFDIVDGNMILHANGALLSEAENIKVEKHVGDLISFQGFKKSFPEYEVFKAKSKNISDKTFTIIGFKYVEQTNE